MSFITISLIIIVILIIISVIRWSFANTKHGLSICHACIGFSHLDNDKQRQVYEAAEVILKRGAISRKLGELNVYQQYSLISLALLELDIPIQINPLLAMNSPWVWSEIKHPLRIPRHISKIARTFELQNDTHLDLRDPSEIMNTTPFYTNSKMTLSEVMEIMPGV